MWTRARWWTMITIMVVVVAAIAMVVITMLVMMLRVMRLMRARGIMRHLGILRVGRTAGARGNCCQKEVPLIPGTE